MSTGDIIFMAVVVGVAILVAILKAINKTPAWLGYVLMGAASLVNIVGGAVVGEYKAVPLGVAGAIGTLIFIVWPKRAKSEPSAGDDTVGGTVTFGAMKNTVEDPRWWVIAGVLAAAVVVAFVIPQAPTTRSTPEQLKKAHVERNK
jgi:hypothetical protein